MSQDSTAPLAEEDVSAILEFLPLFERPDFEPGEWRGGEKTESGAIQMPWFSYRDEVTAFGRALYEHGWIVRFDWVAWQDEARKLVERELDGTDLETLRRLLTLVMRKDRFVEGELAAAFESGLIVGILRRARELRGVGAA